MKKEYIERGYAINLLHYHADEACSSVVIDFEAIPAADVVEVVRCKDCVYNAIGSCMNSEDCDPNFDPNFFCAHGERKGDEQ